MKTIRVALYDNMGLIGYTDKFINCRSALCFHKRFPINGRSPTRAFHAR
jgi:hypothetical protein